METVGVLAGFLLARKGRCKAAKRPSIKDGLATFRKGDGTS